MGADLRFPPQGGSWPHGSLLPVRIRREPHTPPSLGVRRWLHLPPRSQRRGPLVHLALATTAADLLTPSVAGGGAPGPAAWGLQPLDDTSLRTRPPGWHGLCSLRERRPDGEPGGGRRGDRSHLPLPSLWELVASPRTRHRRIRHAITLAHAFHPNSAPDPAQGFWAQDQDERQSWHSFSGDRL